MALIKDYYLTRYEVTLTDCYWKISVNNGISGGKLGLHCKLLCFKNYITANTNAGEYDTFEFYFVPDVSEESKNFLTQAYNYVKTLPNFFGAIDA